MSTMAALPELDPVDVFARADPARALAARRERGWALGSQYGIHLMTYDACWELLRDNRYRIGVTAMLDDAGLTDPVVRDQWMTALLGAPIVDHDRMRRLMSPYFTKRSIDRLGGYVTALTERLVDGVAADGRVEFMSEIALPVPPAVFCRMIGAPEADATQIGALSESVLQIFHRDPALAAEIERSVHDLLVYVQGFVDDRRAGERGDDMVSTLLAAEEGGERLSPKELLALVLEVLEASTDNTANQLGFVLLAAAGRPDDWTELRRDPSLIPAFVEEASRLHPRVGSITRVSDEDTVFRDLPVPAGTVLFATVPSAHLDPEAYVDVERFDLRRSDRRANLNYGSGNHYCIGASLARMEMTRVLEVLVRRWEHVELADEPATYGNIGVYAVERLPLAVTLAR